MVLVDTGFDDSRGCAPHLFVVPWRDSLPLDTEWDMLGAAASEPNPFFERWFLTASLEAFDPQGQVLIAQMRVDRDVPVEDQRELVCDLRGAFPAAERIGDCTITLPMYSKITDEEINYVVDVLRDILSK